MVAMRRMSAVLLAGLLCACASKDPEALISEGREAQGHGDSRTAAERFSAALEQLDAGDAQFFDARIGLVEALITADPSRALFEFLALAAECPDRVGDDEFITISDHMAGAKKYAEAVKLIQTGLERAGGKSPKLMTQVGLLEKKESADKAAINDLKGIGY